MAPGTTVKLKREIELGLRGLDVTACKRAAARAGCPKGKLIGITDAYTDADVANIKLFQQAKSLGVDGIIGQHTLDALVPTMDAVAASWYAKFVLPKAPAGALVYPHPSTHHGPAPTRSGLHETGGLPDNWGLDFMAPGGTKLLAPEAGTLSRRSGHDPSQGASGAVKDIFGWSVYIETPAGLVYFATHLGAVGVQVGQQLKAGDVVGSVGNWPGDPGRSHTHLGVTHPAGEAAAKDHICNVAAAPRMPGQTPI
jgi:murein DD-endopeptidase MepM/ murein hydrolase activator NlpD